MTMSDDSFAQLVIEQGWLSADQVQHAFSSVEELRRSGVEIDLRRWMLVRGLVTTEQIERASVASPPAEERPLGYDYLRRLPPHAGSIQDWVVAHKATGRHGVLRFAVEPAGTRFGLRNEARILAKLPGCSPKREAGSHRITPENRREYECPRAVDLLDGRICLARLR